jgi:hypothetical protein
MLALAVEHACRFDDHRMVLGEGHSGAERGEKPGAENE